MFNPSQIKINRQSTVGTTVHSLQTLLDRTETDRRIVIIVVLINLFTLTATEISPIIDSFCRHRI
jgi:hypothetical protein